MRRVAKTPRPWTEEGRTSQHGPAAVAARFDERSDGRFERACLPTTPDVATARVGRPSLPAGLISIGELDRGELVPIRENDRSARHPGGQQRRPTGAGRSGSIGGRSGSTGCGAGRTGRDGSFGSGGIGGGAGMGVVGPGSLGPGGVGMGLIVLRSNCCIVRVAYP